MDVFFQPEPVIWVQDLMGRGWELPFKIISLLGGIWGILLVGALLLWLSGRRMLYGLIGLLALETVVRLSMAHLVGTGRPTAAPVIKYEEVESFSGFPSGHVASAAVMLGFSALRTRFPMWAAAALVLLVCVGRLYLGVHYLADVLGGLIVAGLLLAAWLRLWPRVQVWASRRGFTFWAGAAALAGAAAIASSFFYLGDSPIRWNSAGLVLGAAIALPLEYRFVRYEPRPMGRTRHAGLILLGLAGYLPAVFVDRFSGEESLGLGAAMVLCATLWVFLAAPAFFALLGWSEETAPVRERAVRRVAIPAAVSIAALAALLIYGMGVEPRFLLDIEAEDAGIPGLAPAWEGRRVALLSDFQFGMWWGNSALAERAVREAVRARPAAVLITGDFIYHPGEDPTPEIETVARVLEPLRASGIPTFAVLGNHDWGLGRRTDSLHHRAAARLRDALRASGVRVLHNESAALNAQEPLYLVGVGSRWADMDHPAEALGEVPAGAPRILLMHNPDSFAELPPGTAPLAAAGHTHGGQVRLPWTPEWSWLTFTSADAVHADGWVDEGFGAEGNRLYVNRGIGMSYLPLRINARPELTIFTLQGR